MSRLTVVGPATTYDFSGNDPSTETVVNPGPGQSLADVAEELHVDPTALAKANPLINDPKQVLSLFQEIRVPENLKPQLPVPYAASSEAQPRQASASAAGSVDGKSMVELRLRQATIAGLAQKAVGAGLGPRDIVFIESMGALPDAAFKQRAEQLSKALSSPDPERSISAIEASAADPKTAGGTSGAGSVAIGAAGAIGGVKIVSPVYQLAGRDIVVVDTSLGRQAFYRSSGANSANSGKWYPVDEFTPGYFNKDGYTLGPGLEKGQPLHRLGNEEFARISDDLGKMQIPEGAEIPEGALGETEDMTANRILDFFKARHTESLHFRPLPDPGEGPPGSPGASGPSGTGGGAAPEGAATTADGAAGELAGASMGEVLGFAGVMLLPFQMMGNYFGSFQEAKDAIKSEAYQEGFAKGIAAGLIGEPSVNSVWDKLGIKAADPSMTDRVLGVEGKNERYQDKGLIDGYKFFRSLSPEQQKQLRHNLSTQGYNLRDKDIDNEIHAGTSLVPQVKQMFENAINAERERIAKTVLEAQMKSGFPPYRPPM